MAAVPVKLITLSSKWSRSWRCFDRTTGGEEKGKSCMQNWLRISAPKLHTEHGHIGPLGLCLPRCGRGMSEYTASWSRILHHEECEMLEGAFMKMRPAAYYAHDPRRMQFGTSGVYRDACWMCRVAPCLLGSVM
ncbi:hypothetical protein CERZMDRAFT_90722 [Cercospora zeae-maydis SCOH1-5]|uniref:Uncharacterized protein n=1 Tax=Cercospora zeae-maydis SCOH1-5 TaxID=717836 RepID=A0A6A6FFI2_9PEZI|nr:hypothetical protein CERZMDRAFT_90722 [Cercospora zeae-maydis SCOH1-5]